MDNCIFCKIAKKQIDTKLLYEDDDIAAFIDLNPQAPTHWLIIPKEHISTTNELDVNNHSVTGKMILAAVNLAKKKGIHSYRLVMNCNEEAGQSVFHIHLHLLGGRIMNWPPG